MLQALTACDMPTIIDMEESAAGIGEAMDRAIDAAYKYFEITVQDQKDYVSHFSLQSADRYDLEALEAEAKDAHVSPRICSVGSTASATRPPTALWWTPM